MSGPGNLFDRKRDLRHAADMRNKVCLVTGATSGHGLACARALARMGAEVILLGRDRRRCVEAQRRIAAENRGKRPDIILCDLSSRAQIDRAAAEILSRDRPLHLLLNNAGVVRRLREESVDGVEMTFAVNYLAPFQLTLRLLDRLVRSSPARIVNVASDAHRIVSLDLDDLQARRFYNFMIAYSRSKLAVLYFTRELARKLAGSGVTINAVDPGPVASGIADHNPGPTAAVASVLIRLLFPSPDRAARTALHLCTSPEVEGINGAYYRFMRPKEPRLNKTDPDPGARLWDISARMTGVDL